MAKKVERDAFQPTTFDVSDLPSPPAKRVCVRKAWARAQPLVDLNALPPEAESPPMPTTSAAPSLGDLGEDLLLHILQLAQPTAWDLSRLACVNRSLRNLCYNPIFWTKLRIGPGSMRAGVEQLASRCAHLEEIHIDDPRCELHVLHPIIMACGPSLKRIVIDCDRDDTSRNEASICSVLWIVSLYCSNVESVELISNGEKGNFNYLENKAMWYLTSGFRRVRSFACLCKNSLTKQAIYLMVIAWRELAYLRIHCGALAKDDLMALRKCYALRVLELIGGNLRQLLGENSVATDAVMHRDLTTIALTNMECDVDDIANYRCSCQAYSGLLSRSLPYAPPRETTSLRKHEPSQTFVHGSLRGRISSYLSTSEEQHATPSSVSSSALMTVRSAAWFQNTAAATQTQRGI